MIHCCLLIILIIAYYYSRFLRARGFSPEAALKQFSASEDWRKKHNVAQVYYSTVPEDLEYSRRFYPCWTGRRDKVGSTTKQILFNILSVFYWNSLDSSLVYLSMSTD